jgi:hypothetical protein
MVDNNQSGGVTYWSDSFGYYRNKVRSTAVYLRCQYHLRLRCPGTAKIRTKDGMLRVTKEHTCSRQQKPEDQYFPTITVGAKHEMF